MAFSDPFVLPYGTPTYTAAAANASFARLQDGNYLATNVGDFDEPLRLILTSQIRPSGPSTFSTRVSFTKMIGTGTDARFSVASSDWRWNFDKRDWSRDEIKLILTPQIHLAVTNDLLDKFLRGER